MLPRCRAVRRGCIADNVQVFDTLSLSSELKSCRLQIDGKGSASLFERAIRLQGTTRDRRRTADCPTTMAPEGPRIICCRRSTQYLHAGYVGGFNRIQVVLNHEPTQFWSDFKTRSTNTIKPAMKREKAFK